MPLVLSSKPRHLSWHLQDGTITARYLIHDRDSSIDLAVPFKNRIRRLGASGNVLLALAQTTYRFF